MLACIHTSNKLFGTSIGSQNTCPAQARRLRSKAPSIWRAALATTTALLHAKRLAHPVHTAARNGATDRHRRLTGYASVSRDLLIHFTLQAGDHYGSLRDCCNVYNANLLYTFTCGPRRTSMRCSDVISIIAGVIELTADYGTACR